MLPGSFTGIQQGIEGHYLWELPQMEGTPKTDGS